MLKDLKRAARLLDRLLVVASGQGVASRGLGRSGITEGLRSGGGRRLDALHQIGKLLADICLARKRVVEVLGGLLKEGLGPHNLRLEVGDILIPSPLQSIVLSLHDLLLARLLGGEGGCEAALPLFHQRIRRVDVLGNIVQLVRNPVDDACFLRATSPVFLGFGKDPVQPRTNLRGK